MNEELIQKLKDIDFHKLEKKTIKFMVGFLVGGLLVVIASKFMADNFDFRIAPISNRPDAYPPPAQPQNPTTIEVN